MQFHEYLVTTSLQWTFTCFVWLWMCVCVCLCVCVCMCVHVCVCVCVSLTPVSCGPQPRGWCIPRRWSCRCTSPCRWPAASPPQGPGRRTPRGWRAPAGWCWVWGTGARGEGQGGRGCQSTFWSILPSGESLFNYIPTSRAYVHLYIFTSIHLLVWHTVHTNSTYIDRHTDKNMQYTHTRPSRIT